MTGYTYTHIHIYVYIYIYRPISLMSRKKAATTKVMRSEFIDSWLFFANFIVVVVNTINNICSIKLRYWKKDIEKKREKLT